MTGRRRRRRTHRPPRRPRRAAQRGRKETYVRLHSALQGRGRASFCSPPVLRAVRRRRHAPLGYALWLSLFSEQPSGLGFGGTETVFTGLGNYLTTLADQAFRDGFLVLLGYSALYIPLMLGGALALALLLDSGIASCAGFFQLALFMPHAVPGVIAALIWVYLYLPGTQPGRRLRCATAGWLGTSSATTGSLPPWSTSPCGSGSATT